MHLRFRYSESTFSYFEATRRYIELHGKPQAFYSDQASVFRVNKKHATSGDGHTQFGRVLYELNIESICANSSQAKGRAVIVQNGGLFNFAETGHYNFASTPSLRIIYIMSNDESNPDQLVILIFPLRSRLMKQMCDYC